MAEITHNSLLKLGFSQPPTMVNHLVCSFYARDKEGKTNMALTAPPPIAFFDVDMGVSELLDKFQHLDKKNFLYYGINYDGEDDDLAEKEVKRALEAYHACLAAPLSAVRSIVFDTDTEFWEMLRLARFGKIAEVPPNAYATVNREYIGIIKAALRSDKNVILLNQMKEEWVSPPGKTKEGKKKMAQWSGQYIRDCMKRLPYLVQLSARLFRDSVGYNCEITRCRRRPEEEGTILTTEYGVDAGVEGGGMCNFPFVAATATGTDIENWM